MRNLMVGLVLVVCGAAGAADAQERQYGAKVGPAFSTTVFEPEESAAYGWRNGGAGGLFYVRPITPALALQFEALYVQKGGKLEDPDFPVQATLIFDYVEFPVLLRVGSSRRDTRGVHVFGGGSAGLRVSARRQFTAAQTGGTIGESHDIRNEIERFEASLIAGAGIDLHRHVVLDGRYWWGLTPVNRDREGGFRVRTRVVAVMLGIRL
jgi:hypothetical protein